MTDDASDARSAPAFSRRPHRDGDDVALLELLRAAFGEWPRVEVQVEPIDHLRWKLCSSSDSPGLHRITEVDGQIASSVFCWVQPVKVRDRLARNIQGTDRAVHPAFQQQGLAEAIGRWRRQHPDDQACDFQFGVRSGHPAQQRLRERARDRMVSFGNLPQGLSLLRPDAIDTAVDNSEGISIRQIDRFDERIDAFWDAASRPFDFILERKRDYLNWRYADPRSGRFAIFAADQGDALLGYAVARVSHGRGYVADLLCLPDRIDAAGALLERCRSYLWEAGMSRIDYWLPSQHPYRQLTERAGFVAKREAGLDIFVHNTALDLSFLDDPSSPVHLSIGDTDLV